MAELAVKGTPVHEVARALPQVYMKYSRHYRDLTAALNSAPRIREITCTLIIGPGGVGKSHYVYSNHDIKEIYKPPLGKTIWFDFLNSQKVLFLEEFSGDYPLTHLLRLLDKYPELLPVKGSFTSNSSFECVYLSTNNHPLTWYNYENRQLNYLALVRRITKVLDFTNAGFRGEPVVLTPDGRAFLEFFSGQLRVGESFQSVSIGRVNGVLDFIPAMFQQ